MKTIDMLMQEHPFFQGLAPEQIAAIADCGKNVSFNEEAMVIRERDFADQFFVIRKGKVAIQTSTSEHGPITIQTVEEGDILGWSWIVPPHKWQFDARAIEPTTAIALDARCLRGKCEQDPKLGYELFKRFAVVFSERLQATRMQLLDVYSADPKRK